MQKSLEVEYWVTDERGALTTPGTLTEHSEYVEEEFVRPLFELKTPPCETMADLRRTFVAALVDILERAEALGKRLVPLGTPVNCGAIDRWTSERTRIQEQVMGSALDYANYCAGTHLHFEKRNVVDQLNTLIALDPALALVNSSPYFQGEYVASSARAYCYREKCYEQFPRHGQLWDYAHTVAEWETRLDRCFEEFKAAAVETGVPADDVDEHFSRDDVVWAPVRLRAAMPTVEWRAPDSALPSQILRLATEMDAVMERLHHTNVTVDGRRGEVTDDCITLPRFEAVDEYAHSAIHDGLASDALAGYLSRMGFDVPQYDPLSATFETAGTVGPAKARELRLQYADRLQRDVEALRCAIADGSPV